jgi:hypothetical protein
MRRILATIVALSGLVLGALPAQAGSLVINTASGSIGGITMTNLGVNGSGTATIEIGQLPNTQSFLNNVNGITVAPDPVAVEGPITLLVTPSGAGVYSLALSPPTYEAVFGSTPGAQGIIAFNQTEGVSPLVLPTFFNMSGTITSVLSNLEPTYDFSKTVGGSMNFAITGTTFTGTSSFAGLFATPGAKVTASGSFSLSAVPEPPAVVLMGMSSLALVVLVFLTRNPRVVKTS